MRLLIDAGNTRVKWALVDGDNWLQSGVLPIHHSDELPQHIADLSKVRQVWVSNVAGEVVAQQIRDFSLAKGAECHFIVAQPFQCGVRNSYPSPSQLGSDRWAALIAAWYLLRENCLVVNSGTATTVDTLSTEGVFLGGLILPGLDLMGRSLAAATAQLGDASGKQVLYPTNTAEAIYNGVLQASCGAVERQYHLLGDVRVTILLSGGGADALQKNLSMPTRIVDNLVLQGLLLIAREMEIK
jgi:type III pantothenate kinase